MIRPTRNLGAPGEKLTQLGKGLVAVERSGGTEPYVIRVNFSATGATEAVERILTKVADVNLDELESFGKDLAEP